MYKKIMCVSVSKNELNFAAFATLIFAFSPDNNI